MLARGHCLVAQVGVAGENAARLLVGVLRKVAQDENGLVLHVEPGVAVVAEILAVGDDEPVPGEDDREEDEPAVREDRDAGDETERRAGQRPAGDEGEPEHRRPEQLVEDLAVAVDVVPDEVRLQRRRERCDETDARREAAAADLVDDERGGRRHEQLRSADRPPVLACEPVDEPEKPAVQRLRVRRRLAGHVAERAGLQQDARERVRLLHVVEDSAALVQEHGEARQHACREHDCVGASARHAAARKPSGRPAST